MRSVTAAVFAFSLAFLAPASASGLPDMAPAARQVLSLFRSNDVVMLGEIHHVHEQRALLTAIAAENGRARVFDALATEALWTVDQPKLDHYLATGEEKEVFLEEGWFNSVNIREAFRQFRANRDKVCAVDIDFYGPDHPKRGAELKERFLSFPRAVQARILKHAGVKNLAELLRSQTFFDREYLMAVAIDRCLKAGRKVLVHLGSDHISSQDPVFQKQTADQPWDTTQWLSFLSPEARFVTVKNMIDVPEDLDGAGKAMTALYRAKKAPAPFLMQASELPAAIKKLMTEDGIELWRRQEYVIVGPAGTLEKKVKPR
jgi:hypothetical protein